MSLDRIGANIMALVLASRQEEAALFASVFCVLRKCCKVTPSMRESQTSIQNIVSYQGGLRVRVTSRTRNGVR